MSRRLSRPVTPLVALGTLAVSFATAAPAHATTPGANGRLAYSVAPEDKSRTDDIPGPFAIESSAPDGSARTVISAAKATDREGAKYSPDGKQIAWLSIGRKSPKGDGLYVAASDGSGARRVAKSSWTEDVAWSPDGKTLVYSNIVDTVFSVRADGSAAPVKILDQPADGGYYRRPTFSPDGSTIVLEHDTESSNVDGKPPWMVSAVLMRINTDGSGLAPLLPKGVAPPFASEPDYAPDGKSIVFDGQPRRNGPTSVYVARVDGSSVRTLFTAHKHDWIDGPTWSPDGTLLAFSTGGKPKQGASLLTFDPVTAKQRVVRHVNKGAIAKPSWQVVPAAG